MLTVMQALANTTKSKERDELIGLCAELECHRHELEKKLNGTTTSYNES